MEQQGEPIRVKMPRHGEVVGEVEEMLGASRFRVRCSDGKVRVCRIPGRFRKRINIRNGFLVLVRPWQIEADEKGDILWIYNKTEAGWMRKRGFVR